MEIQIWNVFEIAPQKKRYEISQSHLNLVYSFGKQELSSWTNHDDHGTETYIYFTTIPAMEYAATSICLP